MTRERKSSGIGHTIHANLGKWNSKAVGEIGQSALYIVLRTIYN
jgi:hypothetical protein